MLVILSNGIHQSWRSRRVTDGFPHCSGCNYNLQGVSKLRCPECGKPLHVHTVLFRGDRQPLSLSGRLLMWTSFLPGPMILLFMLFMLLWPTMYETKWKARLRFTAGNQTVNVAMEFEDFSFFEPATLEAFDMLLATSAPSSRALRIDVVKNHVTWRLDDSSNPIEGALDRNTLVQFLDDFNLLDQQLDARPAFADTLLELVDLCKRDRESQGQLALGQTDANWTTNYYATRTGQDSGTVLGIVFTLALGGGIWAWGISIITRHYENDWQDYTQSRQVIYSRFRDHVEGNSVEQHENVPTNLGDSNG